AAIAGRRRAVAGLGLLGVPGGRRRGPSSFLQRRATATACASSERRRWPAPTAGDGLGGAVPRPIRRRRSSSAWIQRRGFEVELASTPPR
ncbi:Os04g0309400, partial [Oryza sativa Japonica Group]